MNRNTSDRVLEIACFMGRLCARRRGSQHLENVSVQELLKRVIDVVIGQIRRV